MSGQIGERVWFFFLNSWIPTIDSEVYCICLCARESERERVLNIHLLHKRFLFQFQVPLVLCHRACGWMWENLKVTCLTSEKLLFSNSTHRFCDFFFLHHGKSAIKEKKRNIQQLCFLHIHHIVFMLFLMKKTAFLCSRLNFLN